MLRFMAIAFFGLVAISSAEAASCGVTAGSLDFGIVDSLYSVPADSAASVQIDCDQVSEAADSVVVCIHLGGGSGGHGGGTRRLASGARTLNYQLYQDSNRSIDWGSADIPSLGAPLRVSIPAPGETASVTVTLYGRVFGSQISTETGSYTSAFSGADASFAYAEDSLDCDTPGGAGTGQASFTVDAAVSANCLVEASNIEFGQHAIVETNIDAEGSVDITCTPGTDYSVTLGGGLRNSTDPAQRILQSGSDQATYGLYQDDARTLPWGSSLQTQLPGTGAGSRQSVVVYGRVPPQSLRPGTYSDTVNVTITYDDVP